MRAERTSLGMLPGAGVGALGALVSLAVPPLAQPGPESALLLGLLLPPVAAAVAARASARGKTPTGAWRRGVAGLLAGLLAALAVQGLAALLAGRPFCAPWRGLAFWAMGPLLGGLLAVVVGALLGAALRGRACWATVLGATLPWLAALWGVVRFHDGPAVALFGHFAGWFPGTPYDERLAWPQAYGPFRWVSAAWGAGAALFTVALWRGRQGWIPWRSTLLGLCCWAVAALVEGHAGAIGHEASVEALQRALPQRLRGERCVLHAPAGMSSHRLRRHLLDCDFRVEQMAGRLGVEPPDRLDVYWFASAADKQRLLGAGRTHVAKPWRAEVYVQDAPWPHPVLAHEVAHVVAAAAARGPWRVAGRLGGWLPEPVLIEGLAVALAWRASERASPHQWARALLERGQLPGVWSLRGLRFLLRSPPHAYTAAGSLLRFVLERRGAEALRRVYEAGDLSALGDLARLEADWHRFLRSVELPDALVARIDDRFAPRGIVAVPCARPLAELRREAAEALGAGAWRVCGQALARWERLAGPQDGSLAVLKVRWLAEQGRIEEAAARLAALRARGLAASLLAEAERAVAGARWRAGQPARALAAFERLLRAPLSPGALRVVEVSRLGLLAGGEQERLLRRLFAAAPGRQPGAAEAMALAERLGRLRRDGLGPYLAAGLLLREAHHAEAAERLGEALERGLPTERLRREALRRRALALTGADRLDEAARAWRLVADSAGLRVGLRLEAEDFLERIVWRRRKARSAD